MFLDERPITGLRTVFATLLFALFVAPIGHGCSLSHRHTDEEEDDEPFRVLLRDHENQEPYPARRER